MKRLFNCRNEKPKSHATLPHNQTGQMGDKIHHLLKCFYIGKPPACDALQRSALLLSQELQAGAEICGNKGEILGEDGIELQYWNCYLLLPLLLLFPA